MQCSIVYQCLSGEYGCGVVVWIYPAWTGLGSLSKDQIAFCGPFFGLAELDAEQGQVLPHLHTVSTHNKAIGHHNLNQLSHIKVRELCDVEAITLDERLGELHLEILQILALHLDVWIAVGRFPGVLQDVVFQDTNWIIREADHCGEWELPTGVRVRLNPYHVSSRENPVLH